MNIKCHERTLFSQYYFLYFIGAGAFYPFIALYFQSFGVSETQIGFILSSAPIVTMMAQPLWGLINDYLKREKLLIALLSIGTVTMLLGLLYLNHSYTLILVFYLLTMLFLCGLMPIVDRLVTNFCVQSGKITFGQIRIWGSIAWGISSFITGKCIGLIGIQLILYIFMMFLILSGVLVIRFPKTEKQDLEKRTIIEFKDIKELMSNKLFLGFVGLWLLHQISFLGSNAYFSLYLVELGGSADHVGIATMIGILAEAPAILYFSRHSQVIGELKLVLLALILTSLRTVGYILFPSVSNLILLYIVTGTVSGIFLAITTVFIVKIVSQNVQTTALTLFIAIVNGVGNWFGVLVFGYFVELAGYRMAYAIMLIPLGMAISILVYLLTLNKKKRSKMNAKEEIGKRTMILD